MTQQVYAVEACYNAGTSSRVTFPEGKSWADVKDWFVKWDTLYVLFEGEQTMRELELNSDGLDAIDWKRPTSVSVYPVDADGDVDYEDSVGESSR